MKLERLKQLAGLTEARPGEAFRDPRVPSNPQQGLINDLLAFRSMCANDPERKVSCAEIVKELNAIIRKNYGAMTDI
jgi:hypothetical protein